MKPISRLISYDPAPLEGKVPPELRFGVSSFNDYPFWTKEDFLDTDTAQRLFQEAFGTASIEPAKVKAGDLPHAKVDRRHRSTDWLNLDKAHETLFWDRFLAIKPEIERFFNLLLLENSGLQVLGYKKGDFYDCHADNCSILTAENGEIIAWQPVASQRKITTVCFLNDDYEGGQLRFDFLYENGQPLVITPKKGMLIAFASNPYFAHSVLEVLQGYRISLVVWHDALRL